MRKIITGLFLLGMMNNAQAKSPVPIITSAAAVSMAAHASSQAYEVKNTIGLGVLAGKQIENCLMLQAYWDGTQIVCICLDKNKDYVYSERFYWPRDDFAKGVFDELRKQFTNKGE